MLSIICIIAIHGIILYYCKLLKLIVQWPINYIILINHFFFEFIAIIVIYFIIAIIAHKHLLFQLLKFMSIFAFIAINCMVYNIIISILQ